MNHPAPILAILLLILAPIASHADEPPHPWLDKPIARLDLLDGTTYLDLRIVEISEQLIRIVHAAQAEGDAPVRIRNRQLRPVTREALGMPDPAPDLLGQYRVLQVLEGGYLVREEIRQTGSVQALTNFITRGSTDSQPPAAPVYRYLRGLLDRAIADGDHLRVYYLATEDTHQYTDTTGAVRTIRVVQLLDQAPPAP